MKLFSWGSNSHGQLGQGIKCEQSTEPLAIDLNIDVKCITGGGKHTVLISKDGRLLSCGDNSQSQSSNDKTQKSLISFLPVHFQISIIKISCGWDFNLGLTNEGSVFGWGGNSFGQLGLPKENALVINEPVKIYSGKAVDVGAGLRHSVIVCEKGFVFSSGQGRKGQLGISFLGNEKFVDSFTQVPSIENALKVSCGENHCVVYCKEKGLFAWGDNKFGQLGLNPGRHTRSGTPIQIDYQLGTSIVDTLASGWSHNAILTDGGKVISWGRNDYGQLGEKREENWKPQFLEALDSTKQIAIGSNHGVALKRNGHIFCWGWNEHGNCGNGTCENVHEPALLNTFGYEPELIGTELEDDVLEEEAPEENSVGIPRLDSSLSYSDFFRNFLMRNKPCIFRDGTKDWKCETLWVKNGALNADYFEKEYGLARVPVSNCSRRWYNVQEKSTMMMNEYLSYWKSRSDKSESLYLKDWHFTKDFPNEKVYRVPSYFASDWLNEYYDNNRNLDDDFRFVYIGPKSSWTPFHSDVLTSFSWSANISGRKKWILLEPGVEEHFRDESGNLKYDIDPADVTEPGIHEVFQEKGEVIFVPSNWHHQVWNLEDAISINHNWINACNIYQVWESVKSNLADVKREISDCRGSDGWKEDCQKVLKASFGFDYRTLFGFVHQIASSRIESLKQKKALAVFGNWSVGRNHLIFDLKRILSLLRVVVEDEDFRSLDLFQLNPTGFVDYLKNFLEFEV